MFEIHYRYPEWLPEAPDQTTTADDEQERVDEIKNIEEAGGIITGCIRLSESQARHQNECLHCPNGY